MKPATKFDVLDIIARIRADASIAPKYRTDADIIAAMELLAEGNDAASKNPQCMLAFKVAHQKAAEAIRTAADARLERLRKALGV